MASAADRKQFVVAIDDESYCEVGWAVSGTRWTDMGWFRPQTGGQAESRVSYLHNTTLQHYVNVCAKKRNEATTRM